MEENKNSAVMITRQPEITPTIVGSNSEKILNVLFENIEKVKLDPKYIPQAEAIVNNVKNIIDLGKAEIEMIKVNAFINQKI